MPLERCRTRVDFDALLIACGTRPEPALAGAFTFRGPADVNAFRRLLGEFERGTVRRLVFAVPAGIVWQLPLYELALLTAAHLAGRGVVDVELAFVTPEEEPLQLFGPEASAAVRVLLEERGIVFRGRTYPVAFGSGRLAAAIGNDRPSDFAADAVVALPRLRGVTIEGVPQDRDGFIKVDRHGRVSNVQGLYAAGDITSFPVKQGGLAAQEAVAAAETIAAAAGAPVTPKPFHPVLRGMLLTDSIPRYLRTALTGGEQPEVAVEPLWWSPTKIAARHLSPYLAGRALEVGETGITVEVDFGESAVESVGSTDTHMESPEQTEVQQTTDEQAQPHDQST